uniref:Sodium/potassium-transporting ATPase subunit beta-2 n=1 Tax=Timema bartmani TaxID=61472 RepID=A0A7R9F759_9NEOP|nr:unnamed protein product [Timema bartmani]
MSKLEPQDDTLFAPPPYRSPAQTFFRFLYNRDEGTFLGRTGASWEKKEELEGGILQSQDTTMDLTLNKESEDSDLLIVNYQEKKPYIGGDPMSPGHGVRQTYIIYGFQTHIRAKIGIFYLVFYGVLAALFAICMWVFFQTLDPRIPKWQLDHSIIGTSPGNLTCELKPRLTSAPSQIEINVFGLEWNGLGFRPMPPEENVESTLIWYKATDEQNYRHWTQSLETFLEVYRKPGLTPGRGQNIYNCDYDKPPGRGQVCNVDVKNWVPCTQENKFNYHKSAPCVFVKLNKVGLHTLSPFHDGHAHSISFPWWICSLYLLSKVDVHTKSSFRGVHAPYTCLSEIYNWIPEFYNDTDRLPDKMPADLKQYIHELKMNNQTAMLNTVWVSCEGENPADKENLGGIKYYPTRGFPGYFYPYENSEGYLSPIIAINFERPTTGILINIECRAWARNIQHDRHERVGMVHFELMID